MNTFLIPTDFSETSKNAARFAANLANSIPDTQLVLYNVLDTLVAGSDGSLLHSDDETRQALIEMALRNVKAELTSVTSVPMKSVVEENHDFVGTLDRYIRHNSVQLVIMGKTGVSRLGQIFVGSNTLKVIEKHSAPVMIVPHDAKFKTIKNVMLICDFKDIEKTIPINDLKNVLNLFRANLHVVSASAEHYVQLTPDKRTERLILEDMLKEYKPEFYYIRMLHFMEVINQFVTDKSIDMIITIPKSHSFLSHFFKTSHTSQLAYQAHVPILAIHS